MPYTDADINAWPSDSYAGRERDLADMLDDPTLEYYEMMTESWDENYTSWAIFNLLMMHQTAAENMTIDHPGELISSIREDANDSSGDYFQLRLEQRIRGRKELRNIATDIYRSPQLKESDSNDR